MGIVTPKTIVVNYEGFYNPTRDQINRMIKEGYIKKTVWEDITFIDEAKELENLI
jgi:predicted Rossmann-fold nucleotide-binding protein